MIKELGNIKLFRYYHFITKWSLIFTCIFWLGFKIAQRNIDLDYDLFIGLYAIFYFFLSGLALEGDLTSEQEIAHNNTLSLKESVDVYGKSAVIKSVTLNTARFAIIPLFMVVFILKNYPEIYNSLNEAAKAVIQK
ncbi:hypothetical protein [Streptococcus hyointestinalis]|uniref:hypothetical protein n=1 Tax=Streptococcus hyointestinalis TaxID=1337 RepID=UPI003F9B17E1